MRRFALIATGLALICSGCATAFTGSPTLVSPNGATLAGTVASSNAGAVEYWIQYGPTQSYGWESAHASVNAASMTPVGVTAQLAGLQRATIYHYRLCARDSQQPNGPGCGEDRTFTTQRVGCGETVTTDVQLTGNLDCPQTGLVLGADGAEIDLAGYAIVGHADPSDPSRFTPFGINNTGAYDDVIVRDGKLTGFATGFVTGLDPDRDPGGTRNHFINLDVSANWGLWLGAANQSEVRNSRVFGRQSGIDVVDAADAVIADNRASGDINGAIEVSGNGARILRNAVTRQGAQATSSRGIGLFGNNGQVAENQVTGSWAYSGIYVYGADDSVLDNLVTGAGVAGAQNFDGDGIFISGFSGIVVRGNRVDHNRDDGIQTYDPGTRLGDNSANSNGDFGIDAATGSIDLGGNTASGNGNPLQCRNVFCQ